MEEGESKVHFQIVRFIHEAGQRLHYRSIPLATASVLYHMFFRHHSTKEFDPYLIATTSLYLAGKTEEEPGKLRDVINVCYRVLHKNKPPLEMGDLFWGFRDSVANCELFLLRMLEFKVVLNHPHKYLLHYLTFLRDWFEPFQWDSMPVTRTAWAILRDSYHGTVFLHYKPEHIAIAVLYFALECHGVTVPHDKLCSLPWWKVFDGDITTDRIKCIIMHIIKTYDLEDTNRTKS